MEEHRLSMNEAADRYLATLPVQGKMASQTEVYKFVRWYGRQQPLSKVRAPEVGNYAEWLAQSDTDFAKKLDMVRAFFIYAKKEGWTSTDLATHLKVRKKKSSTRVTSGRRVPRAMQLTQEGYDLLESELEALKVKRPQVIDEIRRAAADKDFRENAPLEAARQQHGQIEGRIREIEYTLKTSILIDSEKRTSLIITIGDTVILNDLLSGEELRYTLVSPREVNPLKGKISDVSPVGKTIIGRMKGEEVEVTVPAGKLRYKINHIER